MTSSKARRDQTPPQPRSWELYCPMCAGTGRSVVEGKPGETEPCACTKRPAEPAVPEREPQGDEKFLRAMYAHLAEISDCKEHSDPDGTLHQAYTFDLFAKSKVAESALYGHWAAAPRADKGENQWWERLTEEEVKIILNTHTQVPRAAGGQRETFLCCAEQCEGDKGFVYLPADTTTIKIGEKVRVFVEKLP